MTSAQPPVRDEFFESLLSDFLDESAQLLDRLNENLLELDEWANSLAEGEQAHCNDELMNDMFRSAHSLKGLSAMLGLREINDLTHKVENVFDAARRAELYLTPHAVELMFQAHDRLTGLVAQLKDPAAPEVSCDSVLNGIGDLLSSAGVERKQTSQADAEKALEDLDEPAVSGDAGAVETPSETPAESVADAPAEISADAEPTTTEIVAPTEQLVDLLADLVDDQDVPPKYLSIFIDETEMALDSLTETLLAEADVTAEAMEQLLIVSHRIKGSAACVGLNRCAKLAHHMEDLLETQRRQKANLTPDMTDTFLKCIDALRTYVESLKVGRPDTTDFNVLCHGLMKIQETVESSSAQPSPPPKASADVPAQTETEHAAWTHEDQVAIADHAPESSGGFVGRVRFDTEFPLVGLKAQLAHEKILQLGRLYHCDPTPEQLEEIDVPTYLTFGLATDVSRDVLLQKLQFAGIADVEVHAVSDLRTPDAVAGPVAVAAAPSAAPRADEQAPAAPPAAAAAKAADGGGKSIETLRVDIERLDQLMNLAGQLVINKARFARIGVGLKQIAESKQSMHALKNAFAVLGRMAESIDACEHSKDLNASMEGMRFQVRRLQGDMEVVREEVDRLSSVRNSISDLDEAVHQLDRVSEGIQRSVMDTRMVPIGPLFGRFRRVVRDITRANGKDIRLEINGEKTELDKRMIDELGDPLIHMIRNSADHGVELPEVRTAAGKPSQGVVSLDAFHRGNSILIRVVDDGKGLDPEKIRAKAIERGIISAADADKMTSQQIFNLVWEPGFSTAEKVTDISGRGMGMDIVRSKIEGINGTVELESVPGEGTTFTVKLPLTLAILPSLMAEINGYIFALPIESVEEIISVDAKDMMTVHGLPTAVVRGRVVSVVRLTELFCWNLSAHAAPQRALNDGATLVIISNGDQEVALSVDRLLGEEDIVIKSMAENFRNVYGIAGASILGDGRVSLILDTTALIEIASRSLAAGTAS